MVQKQYLKLLGIAILFHVELVIQCTNNYQKIYEHITKNYSCWDEKSCTKVQASLKAHNFRAEATFNPDLKDFVLAVKANNSDAQETMMLLQKYYDEQLLTLQEEINNIGATTYKMRNRFVMIGGSSLVGLSFAYWKDPLIGLVLTPPLGLLIVGSLAGELVVEGIINCEIHENEEKLKYAHTEMSKIQQILHEIKK